MYNADDTDYASFVKGAIYEGTSNIQLQTIAKEQLGLEPESVSAPMFHCRWAAR